MNRILKCIFAFAFILLISTGFSSCKQNTTNDENGKVKINDVTYSSLYEAVENAKSGDTIKIYGDVSDNKNIEITKSLSIVGVKNQNNIRPKFFGSLTINATGENDFVEISNIDIVHQGKTENSDENNTLVGVNVVDGGIKLEKNRISLQNEENAENGASGLIVSRKISSKNTKPFIIKGNSFGNYEANSNFNGAMLIKSNDENNFQNIQLNNNTIFEQNSFSFSKNGNQFVSIKCDQTPNKIDFLVTSSSKELIEKLLENQLEEDSTFILKNSNEITQNYETKIPILKKTTLSIEGNNTPDFTNNIFQVQGTVNINSNLKNANFEKNSPTACIIFGKDIQTENVNIQ